ncbi:MAG: S-methyl-5'-thioinosine phosphorylase [Gammaproteobacteria bacterium]|nr:S-methyl-5'-thioinosine phosphorylase [Gammaproteobacteria bacterium]
MTQLAIIGGTGLTSIKGLEIIKREVVHSPYGDPSGPLIYGRLADHELMFLPRHGSAHTIPPHRINYRANLWSLKEHEVTHILAVNAVGGIRSDMEPGTLVIPDQIIDYSWGRTNTFFEDGLESVVHIDFTQPYCEAMRQVLLKAGKSADIPLIDGGTYAATQGPRLETAAEIDRLERDGCDLVGMTGMPEAALARELDICYASVSVVANWAAGKADGEITMESIDECLGQGMGRVRDLLETVARQL